ncbi:MAG TPA: class I SAM-dependent methyltransferase [Bryobacteraceae bacterium]|jgi:SAM-dependent methyltransferase|nr:class I SAM-dependent methyltransferase [Bryobacteraceae bacterium]
MTGGYDPSHFARLVAVEDRHFWFRARNRIISLLAGQAVAELGAGYRVLEVGCGDGNVLRFLDKACPEGVVVGMDYFREGLAYARGRCSCPLVQGDLKLPPFRKTFHLIGIFDVLEHLPDDRQVLHDLWRLLDAQGRLLLTVPADPALWSAFDEAACHCRRYRKEELEQKLKECGYLVEYLTPYMAATYPLVWLSRRLGKGSGPDEMVRSVERDLRVIPVLNWMLSVVLSQEIQWIRRRRQLPTGTSLLAVARKA